ncbi:hypothetical protein ACFCT7_12530 [Fulvivirgaceae bacterium LMO-SS25]
MSYFKIFIHSVSVLFLIHLSFVLTAQNRLLLDKQFVYSDGQLGYTYINPEQEADNILYLAIVDLQSQEIVDFVFHGLEDKIIEGEITLAKNLEPGYYALFAARYGDKEIHYEQFWLRDQNWQQLGGREILVFDENDFLRVKGSIGQSNSQLNIYLPTSSSLLDNPIEVSENGDFEFLVLKDSIIHWSGAFPVWAMAELEGENSQIAIQRFPLYWPISNENINEAEIVKPWLSILEDQVLVHAQDEGEFNIEFLDEKIFSVDSLMPKDTLVFNKSDLPTGELKLSFKSVNSNRFYSDLLLNYPQIAKEFVDKRMVTESGNELILELPKIDHPWVSFGNHFLSITMDNEARVLQEKYNGILTMMDTLDRSWDLVTMRSSDSLKSRPNRSVLFTNRDYLLEFNTDHRGEFSISRSEINYFGFEEGRIRYKEQENRVRLESKYPAIEDLKAQMPFILGTMQLKIIEKDELLSNKAIDIDKSFWNDEKMVIDLMGVVIDGQTIEEKIEEVLDDPFSIDWLNEDWICQHGVINGGLDYCIPVAGNHPMVEERIPLHFIFNSLRFRQKSASSNYNIFRRDLDNANFLTQFGQTNFSPSNRNMDPELYAHSRRAWTSYSWDPAHYIDQIGSVKLPKQNKLLVAEGELSISNGQKVWKEYTESTVVKVKVPVLPGTYTLEVRYWDLHHEISSSISYEVLVR